MCFTLFAPGRISAQYSKYSVNQDTFMVSVHVFTLQQEQYKQSDVIEIYAFCPLLSRELRKSYMLRNSVETGHDGASPARGRCFKTGMN